MTTNEGFRCPPRPKALSKDEIGQIVRDFGHVASLAKECGFDGVEIHAANGFLIDQFLRDGSNVRSDAYGGTPRKRIRFLLEVLEAVERTWPANRIGVRLSPTGTANDMTDSAPATTFATVIAVLDDLGLAYLHVVEGHPDNTDAAEIEVDFTRLRTCWNGNWLANGGYDRVKAAEAIRTGYATAVSFARPYIPNPDLVERFRRGSPLATYDPSTVYGGNWIGYTDYPTLDADSETMQRSTEEAE